MKVNKTNVVNLIKQYVPALANKKMKYFHVDFFRTKGNRHANVTAFCNERDAYYRFHFVDTCKNHCFWATYFYFNEDVNDYVSIQKATFEFDAQGTLIYSTDKIQQFVVDLSKLG